MRRILVVSCLLYMSVAVVVGIHAIVTENDGASDDEAISLEVIDRAILWPLRLFD